MWRLTNFVILAWLVSGSDIADHCSQCINPGDMYLIGLMFTILGILMGLCLFGYMVENDYPTLKRNKTD